MKCRYVIPSKTHRVEEVIKKSRFITTITHVEGAGRAKAFIQKIKREFPDADHNCWAYLAGPPGETASIGMSDDGEPHGTAGRPMLNMLIHSGVGEIAAVVARYFGGIKLGTGGLTRAYSGAVKNALTTLETVEKRILVKTVIQFDYRFLEQIRKIAGDFEAEIINEEFRETVTIIIHMPEENLGALIVDVMNLTNGRATIT